MMNSFSISTYLFLWIMMFLMILMIFIYNLHPVFLIISMITLNIITSLIMSMWKSNYMYSILIFLILISGLLIIFMYFSSLVSNTQTSSNFSSFNFYNIIIFFINLYLIFLISWKLTFLKPYIFILNFMESNLINFIFTNKNMNFMNIYSYPNINITLISIFFLLFSFLTIIKINNSSHSYTMRKVLKYD